MTYKSNENKDDTGGSKISFHAWKILAILSGIATMVLYAETMLVPAIPHLINCPIVFAIVQDQFPRNKVSIAQGTLASMFAFGGVLGLLVGGNIVEHFGWRTTFYSVIPVSMVLIIIIWRYVQVKKPTEKQSIQYEQTKLLNEESKGTNRTYHKLAKDALHLGESKLDIKGAIFLAITITSFLSALSFVQSSDNNSDLLKPFYISWRILLLSLVCFGSLTAFILVERKSSSPLIDLKLIANKPILISNIIVIIWGICTFAIFQTIPILVQSPVITGGIGGNAIDAANIQLPFSITSLVFGPTSGIIISKIGSSKVTLTGAIITTVSLLGILIFHATAIQLAINLATVGVGLALLNVGQLNINTTSVSPRNIGVSLGINTLLRYIGSAIGPAVAGMLMQANQNVITTADGISRAFPSRESYNFIFLFILAAVSITILLSMKIAHTKTDQKSMEKQY